MRKATSQRNHAPTSAGVYKTVALLAGLILGARVMVAAISSHTHFWLGACSLVPVFLAICTWRPQRALFAGALWGLCLFSFSAGEPTPLVTVTYRALLLLTFVPAVYAYAAARLTRWMGFNPFVLGVGWIAVELALVPTGLHTSLACLEGSQGTWACWIGHAFGYVLVAFLLAFANAVVVMILQHVRVDMCQPHRVSSASDSETLLSALLIAVYPLAALPSLHPRGPPARPF